MSCILQLTNVYLSQQVTKLSLGARCNPACNYVCSFVHWRLRQEDKFEPSLSNWMGSFPQKKNFKTELGMPADEKALWHEAEVPRTDTFGSALVLFSNLNQEKSVSASSQCSGDTASKIGVLVCSEPSPSLLHPHVCVPRASCVSTAPLLRLDWRPCQLHCTPRPGKIPSR